MNKNKTHLFNLVLSAILCAVSVVLSRFLSYNVWNLSIGLAFLPIMVSALVSGCVWGGITGGLADFIGALLFPFGTYFPGFTFTAFLTGVMFGLIGRLNKRCENTKFFALWSALILLSKEIICALILSSLWISILYGTAFSAVLITRVPTSAVMLVIEFFSVLLLRRFILPKISKVIK